MVSFDKSRSFSKKINRIFPRIKSNEIAHAAALPFLAAAVVIAIIAILFRTVLSTFIIPNWLTMAVEIGIGIFITFFLFRLQAKTDHSINQTVKKIDQYNENVRLTSLERIGRNLSMAWDGIGSDKDRIAAMDETQQLNFVENLLRCNYGHSAFRALPFII
jgi:hypothetical protein